MVSDNKLEVVVEGDVNKANASIKSHQYRPVQHVEAEGSEKAHEEVSLPQFESVPDFLRVGS